MGLLAWIVLGGLAGWIASILVGRNKRMGCLANVIIGVLGALIGGFLMNLLGEGVIIGFNLRSLGVAILGSLILLLVTGWFTGRRR